MSERVSGCERVLSTAAVLWPPSGYLLKTGKAAVAALRTIGWRNYVCIHSMFIWVCGCGPLHRSTFSVIVQVTSRATPTPHVPCDFLQCFSNIRPNRQAFAQSARSPCSPPRGGSLGGCGAARLYTNTATCPRLCYSPHL